MCVREREYSVFFIFVSVIHFIFLLFRSLNYRSFSVGNSKAILKSYLTVRVSGWGTQGKAGGYKIFILERFIGCDSLCH